jgi:hypothetical protein
MEKIWIPSRGKAILIALLQSRTTVDIRPAHFDRKCWLIVRSLHLRLDFVKDWTFDIAERGHSGSEVDRCGQLPRGLSP